MTLRTSSLLAAKTLPRRGFLLAACALAIPTTGCAALVAGVHDADADFLVLPNSDGSFFGWTEITVDNNIQESSGGQLTAVTLDVEKPAGFTDLSFLTSLKGEAITATARTLILNETRFPKGEEAVVASILYHGDLKPLFKDQHTIRIEWNGTVNPAFQGFPAEGIWIRVRLKVNLN